MMFDVTELKFQGEKCRLMLLELKILERCQHKCHAELMKGVDRGNHEKIVDGGHFQQ